MEIAGCWAAGVLRWIYSACSLFSKLAIVLFALEYFKQGKQWIKVLKVVILEHRLWIRSIENCSQPPHMRSRECAWHAYFNLKCGWICDWAAWCRREACSHSSDNVLRWDKLHEANQDWLTTDWMQDGWSERPGGEGEEKRYCSRTRHSRAWFLLESHI